KIDMPPRRRRSRGPGRVLTGATGLGTGAIVISTGTCGLRRPTVKLRGREPEPDLSRGRTMSPTAPGETTAPHGTRPRLLGFRLRNLVTGFIKVVAVNLPTLLIPLFPLELTSLIPPSPLPCLFPV